MTKYAVFLGTVLMKSSLALAAATTEIRFLDDCTGEALTLGTPNGVRIEVNIQNLGQSKESQEAVVYNLNLGVVESGATQLKPIKILKKKKVWPKDGQVSFQTKVDFKNAQVLQAEVLWTQNKLIGSGASSLLMPGAKFEPFYKKVSEAQCSWGAPVQIESGYFTNNTPDQMAIEKSYTWNSLRGRGHGNTKGPPAISGHGDLRFATGLVNSDLLTGGAPILGASLWYFTGKDTIRSQDEFALVKRKWFLEPGQGGFFATRWWFTRYQAEEHVLQRNPSEHSCWQWTVARRGHLEVGLPTVDFYVVSENESTDLKKAEEIIEKAMPALNTCGTPFEKSKNEQSKFITTSRTTEEEMFFFNADQK